MATRRGGGAEMGTSDGEGSRSAGPGGALPMLVAPGTAEFVGRHRLTAATTRLNQEIEHLQAELNKLETMDPASAACQEVALSTEGKPDALLPVTPGPENAAWERWFQRVRSSQGHKWWMHKGSSDVS